MISIIDIDSKIPNLALKKIEKFYLDMGEDVAWNNPLMASISRKIYVGCVFTKNRSKCLEWEGRAEIGGSGYDISKTLPEEIEKVNPKINMGFTTRGCIRRCAFCIVPEKEGGIHIVGDLMDLWDGKSKDIILMDNNILAIPEHFKLVCKQARGNKIRIDFNQGLDHRLLTQEIVDEMKTIRHVEYRMAYDHVAFRKSVNDAIDLLQSNGIKRCSWYVLCGFNSSFEEDMDRLTHLRDRGQVAYLQRHEKVDGIPEYIELARWVNQHHLFRGMSWQQFQVHPDTLKRKGNPC
jgi:hypothetical protein